MQMAGSRKHSAPVPEPRVPDGAAPAAVRKPWRRAAAPGGSDQGLLLVVGSEAVRRQALGELRRAGYHALAADPSEAEALLRREVPDLAVLPGREAGSRLVEGLLNRTVPVLLVSGPDGRDADGPDAASAAAIIHTAVRRARRALAWSRPASASLSCGALTLDPGMQDVRVDGRTVHLTPREFALVWRMAQEPGRAFSRPELIAEAFPPGAASTENAVNVHVRQIREKLALRPSPLRTVWGRGYALSPDVPEDRPGPRRPRRRRRRGPNAARPARGAG
jgi:DNA-binding response OmpR family regulator